MGEWKMEELRMWIVLRKEKRKEGKSERERRVDSHIGRCFKLRSKWHSSAELQPTRPKAQMQARGNCHRGRDSAGRGVNDPHWLVDFLFCQTMH